MSGSFVALQRDLLGGHLIVLSITDRLRDVQSILCALQNNS